MDSYYNVKEFSVPEGKIDRFIIKTDADYQRYSLDIDNGITPRGIPNHGEGLVRADSDEHDENGLITEDMEVRIKMMEKRNSKLNDFKKEAFAPNLLGPKDYRVLCVGWGSTYHVIKEALDKLNIADAALLHFKQVYPVPEESIKYLRKAKQIISIENNYNGQFAQLLEISTGISIETKILKYNGLPFYSDELAKEINHAISEKGGQK